MTGFHKTEAAIDSAFTRHHSRPFPNGKAWQNAVSLELYRQGERVVYPLKDEAGNCMECGEAGRCPGVHAASEIEARKVGT